MFIYFWFPNYLFEALTFFSWMTWIAPENHTLEILAGFKNGLGVSSYPIKLYNYQFSFDIQPHIDAQSAAYFRLECPLV